ncbi:kinase-like protein [Gigaspora margarita]|uniref:Kinase-like protein n=1 Tax=Gigaspora margarita TaxID=4874 RepID=A0A8H4A4N8_GIGMA|nr:kinase-like protein [Gigaspora margarita]
MGKKHLRCNHPKETFDLCSSCITSHFKEESVTWTSQNQEIDRFIKYTQIMSRNPETAAYWMKWEELTNIKMIGKGGLGKVYSAQLTRRISDEILDEIVALKTVGKPNEFSNILAEVR